MRLQGLDIFRGVAIVLMVTFHFCFDLNYFGYVDFDLKHGEFWRYFRYLVVSMFIFFAGISTQITHKNYINTKKLFKRLLFLGIASILVSVGSYTQFPKSWIYFGVLHFFFISTVIGLPFLRIPKISFILGVFIILGYNMSWINMHWLYNIFQTPLYLPQRYTEDLVSLVPWFGAYLLGLVGGYYKIQNLLLNVHFLNKESRLNAILATLGRHSFITYLSHQVILFATFYTIKFLI